MIPKPGKNPENAASYRPISILSNISKIFERIFQSRLKELISKKNILPNIQFGFRDKHSTVEQAHRLVSHITQWLENKEYSPTVFLDVSQAFDRVWHDGLVYKLSNLLPAARCELIKDYLSDRSFMVKVGNDYSDYRPISAGVPQGSVSGSTLYLLYTYDIPQDSDVTVALFADDTAISASHKSYATAVEQVQHSINRISSWSKIWKISINEGKSVRVDYTLRSHTYIPTFWNNQAIPMASAARYVGIHLDSKLSWEEHVKQKCNFLNSKFRKYYWLIERHSKLSLENKRLLYLTIFKAVWTYGLPIWGTTKDCHREVIQRFSK